MGVHRAVLQLEPCRGDQEGHARLEDTNFIDLTWVTVATAGGIPLCKDPSAYYAPTDDELFVIENLAGDNCSIGSGDWVSLQSVSLGKFWSAASCARDVNANATSCGACEAVELEERKGASRTSPTRLPTVRDQGRRAYRADRVPLPHIGMRRSVRDRRVPDSGREAGVTWATRLPVSGWTSSHLHALVSLASGLAASLSLPLLPGGRIRRRRRARFRRGGRRQHSFRPGDLSGRGHGHHIDLRAPRGPGRASARQLLALRLEPSWAASLSAARRALRRLRLSGDSDQVGRPRPKPRLDHRDPVRGANALPSLFPVARRRPGAAPVAGAAPPVPRVEPLRSGACAAVRRVPCRRPRPSFLDGLLGLSRRRWPFACRRMWGSLPRAP